MLFSSSRTRTLIAGWVLTLVAITANGAPFAYIPTYDFPNNLSIIDLATNRLVATAPLGAVADGVAVNSSGSRAYFSDYMSNTIIVLDTRSRTVIARVPVGREPQHTVINRAGSRLYVANSLSNNISVVDTATNTVVATIAPPLLEFPRGIALNPVNTLLYVLSYSGGLFVFDATTYAYVTQVWMGGGSTREVAVNPAGTRVYITTDFSVNVIDTASNTLIAKVPLSAPGGLVVDPTGAKVFVAGYGANTVSVIDTVTNTITATIPVEYGPWSMSINPAGTKLYVVTGNAGSMAVIDTVTNTVIKSVPLGRPSIAVGQFIGPGPLNPAIIDLLLW